MKRNSLTTGLVMLGAALMIGALACGGSSNKTATATSMATSSTAMAGATETPMAMQTASNTPGGGVKSDVKVVLAEYQVVLPNVKSAPAGTVTFDATNIGSTVHELHVIKTELQPDKLPTKADGSVDEAGTNLTMVDHVLGIAASGGAKSLAVDLAAGNYVLICNVVQTTANGQNVSHYQRGMRVAFRVTG